MRYIGKYIKWYIKKTETSFLDNQITEQIDYLYQKLVLSPNCKKYATLGLDNLIQIRDFQTKELITSICQSSSKGSFLFSFDSSRLVFNDDYSISIWELNYKKVILHIKGKFSCFAFSKRGYYLAFATQKYFCLELYNEDNEKMFKQPLKVATKEVTCLDFSSDVSSIAIGSLDCTITIYDIRTQTLLLWTNLEPNPINKLIYSPNETHIIAGSIDCVVLLWDISGSEGEIKSLMRHKSRIVLLLCSNDQKRIVSVDLTNNMFIWDFDKLTIINEINHKSTITSLTISDENSDKFITSGADNTFLTWDFFKGLPLDSPDLTYGENGKATITSLNAYSPELSIIAKLHDNGIISCWDSITGKFVKKIHIESNLEVKNMAFSLDGSFLAICYEDEVFIYDINNPEKAVKGPLKAGMLLKEQLEGKNSLINNKKTSVISDKKNKISHIISCLSFLPTGDLCVGDESGSVTIWVNLMKESFEIRLLKAHNTMITFLNLNVNQNLFATGSSWGSVRLWDYKTLQMRLNTLDKHENPIRSLIFMGLGWKLISGCSLGRLILWKIRDLSQSVEFPTAPKADLVPKFFNLTENEEFFIVGYQKGEIIVWSFTGIANYPQIVYFYESFDEKVLNAVIQIEEKKEAKMKSAILQINSVNQMKKIKLYGIGSVKTFLIRNAKCVTGNGKLIFSFYNPEDLLQSSSSSVKKKKSKRKQKKEFNKMATMKSWNIRVSDGRSGSFLLDLQGHNYEIIFLKTSLDNSTLLSLDLGGFLYLWDLKNYALFSGPLKSDSKPKAGLFSHDNKTFGIGEEDGGFSIWNTKEGKQIVRLKAHELKVICLDYLQRLEGSLWVTGSKDLKVVVYDAVINIVLFTLHEVFEEGIISTKFWGNRLFVAGSDYSKEGIKAFDFETRILVQSTLLSCKDMCLVERFDKILTYFHDEKNLFHLMILDKEIIENDQAIIIDSPISKEEGEAPLQTIWVNSHDLMCFFDNRVVVYKHLFRNDVLFLREMIQICDFCRKPDDSRFLEKVEAICSGDEGIVFPFMYNLLQAIAYIENSDDSNLLMTVFDVLDNRTKNITLEAFFEKDIHGRNIFDVVFFKKNGELLKNLIDYLIKTYPLIETEKQADLLRYFDVGKLNQMLDIFENDPSTVGSLLDYMFTKPLNYPKNYVYDALEYLVMILMEENELNTLKLDGILKNHYQKTIENKKKYVGKEIVVARCLFIDELINCSSLETRKFFYKISNFESTDELFGNFTINKILEYKWEAYGRKAFLSEGLLFLVFLIVFLINSTYIFPIRLEVEIDGIENNIFFQSALILDIALLGYLGYHIKMEIMQCWYFSVREYLESLWNHFDIILIFLAVPSISLDMISCFIGTKAKDILKVLNSLTIFFSFLRLISYARGIDGSAFMVRLIIQVIIDMKYFLLLMYIFIIGLGYSGYELEIVFSYSHFTAFNTFFTAMLGDSTLLWEMNPDNYYVLYFFFMLSSIILTITLLNLLISIISETFGKVRDNEKLTRVYERWNIITEIDVFMQEKKKTSENQDKKTFLMYIYNNCHEIEEKDKISNILEKAKEFEKGGEHLGKVLKDFSEKTHFQIKEDETLINNYFKRIMENKKKKMLFT